MQSSNAAYSTLAARWYHLDDQMDHQLAGWSERDDRLEVGCASRDQVHEKTTPDQLLRQPRRWGLYNLKLVPFKCATEARNDWQTKPLRSPSHGAPAASIARPIYDSVHELMGF